MINLSRGSQSARYGVVVGNFSSYPAALISLAAGFSRAPFGRQSKRRINRDLITRLEADTCCSEAKAPTVGGA